MPAIKKPVKTTMLDLVTAVSREADSLNEVVATVTWMVNSGSVELCGSFRGERFAFATPEAA